MDTVILTVFNREPLLLMNTLQWLCRNDLTDTEILVVDDGSTIDYTHIQKSLHGLPIRWERIETLQEVPDCYHIDGHKNAAHANNRAIEMARGDNLFFLSSDVMIPPHALERAREWDLDRYMYLASCVNMEDDAVYVGVRDGRIRTFPGMFFGGISKAACERVGGFDENLMYGMGFDDNDFSARLVIDTGRYVIDRESVCYHQWHPPTAYSDRLKGFNGSKGYMKRKWGGIPFDPSCDVLDVVHRDLGECVVFDCKLKKGVTIREFDTESLTVAKELVVSDSTGGG